ncbi:N-acetyltransferase [Halobacillus halophilus]|uniref:Acetyltransferase, GNAT family n=1 Tax=Halobacillus halophilus (strain ATCC 35676 / DSM 2266 / JCM 20832 / KCTC 3685 / LMG 17431 / NBRC 102448 / NCIMB 2269) TaxID=866895 RepID=I0JIR1_HALH3|nr:GNAT family N-acetyltransferase [Halobacillus halophilus]ASF38205.1 N-acetyltransferase [Halobacillus halophilus]CCG44029.1 acetyltransferase, GNAT family [Halobacillus halophilus DSM 2266]
MYQYYNGLVIREGVKGVPGNFVEELFKEAGWVRETPSWQKEKFTLMFENSTWAFTVWDENRMVGMVRVISDQIMAANIMDLVVSSNYRGKGIGQKLVELCVQKLPHGDWFAHTSSNNFSFYKKCGFEVKDLSQNGTCAYYGYIQARIDGDR